MNILYFGTICNLTSYEQQLNGCQSKPSVAPIVFETALLEGFYQNGINNIEIHSFPMIPTYPQSQALHFGGHHEALSCGYKCHWLNTINIPILKQLSRRIDGRKAIKQWVKKHGTSGVIMTYSIPPFLVKDIIKYGKKYSIKTVAIVPDLLQNMYLHLRQDSILTSLKKLYLKPALRFQKDYDGYVYLTELMRNVVSKQKPYIVMEGIANLEDFNSLKEEKSCPRAIMYAGRLHEKYGIIQLLDAFEKLQEIDAELWLFGDGTAVDAIKEKAKNNCRIKYFGQVTRDEILAYEKKATLLVNPRSVQDEFTYYSFPSKTIEYMYSGTPLLTTRLKGIPEEYFDYLFTVDDNDAWLLADEIQRVLMLSDEELTEIGSRAQRFITEKKNAVAQSRRIIEFLANVIGN